MNDIVGAPPEIINHADRARMSTAYPILGLDPLTSQQEMLVLLLSRGMSVRAAAPQAGMTRLEAETELTVPAVVVMVDYMRLCNDRHIQITADMLNAMLLESHKKSATATEEIMAIRELGKLNDLYPSEKRRLEIVPAKITNTRQLERMTDSQLAELAGNDVIELSPDEYEIDGKT